MVGRPLLATTCPWGRVRRSSEAPRSPQQGDAIGGAVAAVVDSVVAPDAASSAALPQWALACAQGPGAASSAALPHQAQGGVTGRAAPRPQAGLDLRDTVAPVAGDSPSLAAGGHRQAAASASTARGGVQTRSAQPWCLLLGGAGQTKGPRLAMLFCELKSILETYHPEEAAVEKSFVSQNSSSTLKLGHARGVIMLAPALSEISVSEYSPNVIKKSLVGSGHASKEQVKMMEYYNTLKKII